MKAITASRQACHEVTTSEPMGAYIPIHGLGSIPVLGMMKVLLPALRRDKQKNVRTQGAHGKTPCKPSQAPASTASFCCTKITTLLHQAWSQLVKPPSPITGLDWGLCQNFMLCGLYKITKRTRTIKANGIFRPAPDSAIDSFFSPFSPHKAAQGPQAERRQKRRGLSSSCSTHGPRILARNSAGIIF